MKCYDNAENKKLLLDLEQGLAKGDRKKEKRSEDECDCLPSCTSIHYDAKVSQTNLDRNQAIIEAKGNITVTAG